MRPGTPGPPPGTPCEFPPRRREVEEPSACPCDRHCRIEGDQVRAGLRLVASGRGAGVCSLPQR